ncbi:MAG: DUF1178 family protein [Burkholderiales bacterium]
MKIFDLVCDHGHRFEGWFGSGEDYERQQRNAQLACPVCASAQVDRVPSAPYIGKARGASTPAGEAAPAAPSSRQPVANIGSQALEQLMRYIVQNTDDVGGGFSEEARKIHYGESADRRIRGTASTDEVKSLKDEGIDVLALPGHLTARRH